MSVIRTGINGAHRSRAESRKLRKTLRRMSSTAREPLKKTMRKVAPYIESEMKKRVSRRTGTVARNITNRVRSDGTNAEIGIRGIKAQKRAFYAKFLESGRKPGQKIYGAKKNYRRALRGKKVRYSYRYSASAPRPFMQPSLEAGINVFRKEIKSSIGEAFDRAARGL